MYNLIFNLATSLDKIDSISQEGIAEMDAYACSITGYESADESDEQLEDSESESDEDPDVKAY